MAVIVDLMQSYDQATVADYSIAQGIHMLDDTETKLQRLLPKVQVGAAKVEWIQDTLLGDVGALAATVSDTTSTEITSASGNGTDLFPNDVATYNVVIRVDQECMLVSGNSSDVLTVTRGYGSTTKATHASAAVIHVISQLEYEGADGKKAFTTARTRPSNYVQTFSRTVEVTGVQEAIKKLGGITSEINYQIYKSMMQLAAELEKTLIFGVADQVGDGSSTFRTMGGLWHMIATNRTSDSGSVDTDAIEADIRTIWDAGGRPNLILTTGKMAQEVSTLYSDRVRTDILNTVGGAAITSIINPLSEGPLYIMPHRMMAAGEYYMLDLSRIALGFLRPFFMKDLADDGDADKRWIGGDYTLELLNEKAHAYRYGFS